MTGVGDPGASLAVDPAGPDLVPAGTPIDLDNCAREPIHIPGSIQPRGVMLVAREPELTITQASANLPDLLGVTVEDALGAALGDVIGRVPADAVARASAAFTDLRERNPLDVVVTVDGRERVFDAILHRAREGILLVELELADGPRPFSFPNTYLAVRGSVAALNRAASLEELYEITAQSVRELTGFDRVMVYRYDHEYNGEVVAEARREDLNSFLGLHYPASDIPAQARALYEKNWIRLISDVRYTPSPLVPTDNPITGAPLDLTYSTLRSVSPVHVEYLRNMGVRASMSISLLRDGQLWGLIACHHYAGPHVPPYGARTAAEFLGSTLSLRLVDRAGDEELRVALETQSVLSELATAALDQTAPLADALFEPPGLERLIAGGGVAAQLQDRYATAGAVPDEATVRAIVGWARAHTEGREQVTATDALGQVLPDLGLDPATASGVLVLELPDDQFVAWFRAEVQQSVDWGGDPHNKAIAVQEPDGVRLSPRRSFERWRETTRGRSLPWTSAERDTAAALRRTVVESLYHRARGEARIAETLQRSLLPHLPELTHWQLSAHYEPAEGGHVGGDWYDAFRLRDGRLIVVLGDVAGHGIGAAGTMTQLRNALRAYLFEGAQPADAVARLNDFVATLLPLTFASLFVARIDLDTGEVEAVTAGHPIPRVVDGTVRPAPVVISPPVGVLGASYRSSAFALGPGEGLVLFSDGLIERRDESIDDGLARLGALLADLEQPDAHTVWRVANRGDVGDDATVLALHRPVIVS